MLIWIFTLDPTTSCITSTLESSTLSTLPCSMDSVYLCSSLSLSSLSSSTGWLRDGNWLTHTSCHLRWTTRWL